MSVNRHFPKTSVRLRRLTHTRGAVDVAMDVLHLRLDVLQAARAIQQRLRMLGKLRVRQIRLIPQRMLQACLIIHGDGA